MLLSSSSSLSLATVMGVALGTQRIRGIGRSLGVFRRCLTIPAHRMSIDNNDLNANKYMNYNKKRHKYHTMINR